MECFVARDSSHYIIHKIIVVTIMWIKWNALDPTTIFLNEPMIKIPTTEEANILNLTSTEKILTYTKLLKDGVIYSTSSRLDHKRNRSFCSFRSPYNDKTQFGEIIITRISNTSRGHLCILSRKYFPITLVDREKSGDHNEIYFMAFALKEKVLKIVKEKVISTRGRGHYVMQYVVLYVMN